MRKLEAMLGFALHLTERIARREHVAVQVVTAVRRKSEVTALVRRLERAAHQITAGPDMSRPWQDASSKEHIGSGLEAPQSALFDQFIAQPTEAKSGLVIAKMRASDPAKHCIGEA